MEVFHDSLGYVRWFPIQRPTMPFLFYAIVGNITATPERLQVLWFTDRRITVHFQSCLMYFYFLTCTRCDKKITQRFKNVVQECHVTQRPGWQQWISWLISNKAVVLDHSLPYSNIGNKVFWKQVFFGYFLLNQNWCERRVLVWTFEWYWTFRQC